MLTSLVHIKTPILFPPMHTAITIFTSSLDSGSKNEPHVGIATVTGVRNVNIHNNSNCYKTNITLL